MTLLIGRSTALVGVAIASLLAAIPARAQSTERASGRPVGHRRDHRTHRRYLDYLK